MRMLIARVVSATLRLQTRPSWGVSASYLSLFFTRLCQNFHLRIPVMLGTLACSGMRCWQIGVTVGFTFTVTSREQQTGGSPHHSSGSSYFVEKWGSFWTRSDTLTASFWMGRQVNLRRLFDALPVNPNLLRVC